MIADYPTFFNGFAENIPGFSTKFKYISRPGTFKIIFKNFSRISRCVGTLCKIYVISCLPVNSGKQMARGDFLIFSSNRSFLLRKRMMEVSVNHLLLQIESNNFMLSIMRFCQTLTQHHLDLLSYIMHDIVRALNFLKSKCVRFNVKCENLGPRYRAKCCEKVLKCKSLVLNV